MTNDIQIKPVHTAADLVIAAAVLAAGVSVYFLLPGWGILFGLIGILLFVFYKRAYKRAGEGTLLKQKSVDIAPEYRDAVMDFLSGKADSLEFMASEAKGDHLYLEVYFNADEAVAYAQLYDVADNAFEPATEIVELRGAKASKLISKL